MLCELCFYWEEFKDNHGRGRCKRYPLVFLGIDPSCGEAIFDCPETGQNDWCGEYMDKT